MMRDEKTEMMEQRRKKFFPKKAEEVSIEDLDAQIAALKGKKKELKMKEAAFRAEIDARKAEILERWGSRIRREKIHKKMDMFFPEC